MKSSNENLFKRVLI